MIGDGFCVVKILIRYYLYCEFFVDQFLFRYYVFREVFDILFEFTVSGQVVVELGRVSGMCRIFVYRWLVFYVGVDGEFAFFFGLCVV